MITYKINLQTQISWIFKLCRPQESLKWLEILLQTIFEFKNTSKNVFTVSFIKKLFLILNKNNSDEISIYLEECLKNYSDFKKTKKLDFEKINILDLQLQILELKKQISKIN